MRRRTVVLGGAASAVLAAIPVRAQPAAVRRIAILEYGDMAARASSWAAFDRRLRELGYVEGRNLHVERRWAQGVDAQLPALGRELLAARPQVVLVNTTPATQVLMRRPIPYRLSSPAPRIRWERGSSRPWHGRAGT